MESKKRKAAEITGGAIPQAQQAAVKRRIDQIAPMTGPRQSFEQIQKAEKSKKFKEDLPQQGATKAPLAKLNQEYVKKPLFKLRHIGNGTSSEGEISTKLSMRDFATERHLH